ncbi:cysteine-rich CWC family protein [Chitinophaga solisilvae]|uniref:cysteine-rich CWC family protein n=1 Tax=Chitinophaga solisilvae TaxID=1233460 RepID=UPI00136822FF|nr:cysteine-rich CWC family protein [Chitinophaga solisilvae]
MCEHETKSCPRCGGLFECKVGSILLCHCADVQLNETERQFISSQYQDCLCHECLLQMKEESSRQ